MIRMLATATILATAASAAGAVTFVDEPVPPEFITEGSQLDFSRVAVGSSKVIPVEFSLGETGQDESQFSSDGPFFELISGSENAFFLESVSCDNFGVGLLCLADAVFRPTSLRDFLSVYEISALMRFTEIHEPEGEEFEYEDSFQVSFSGTGMAAVPLPPAAAASLAALGMLGLIGRRRRSS